MNLIDFIHKKSYERIIKTVRRSPVTFIPYVLIFLILALVPAGVFWLINTMFPALLYGNTSYPAMILFGSTYYLCICLFFYSYFVAFYLDIWIITNDRLVDVRQISLFAKSISELDLYQIQDATSEVEGFFPSIFNYGTVTLQTAGSIPKFIIYDTPHPHELRQLLLDLASEDKRYHAGHK
jgi:hypothetical protein